MTGLPFYNYLQPQTKPATYNMPIYTPQAAQRPVYPGYNYNQQPQQWNSAMNAVMQAQTLPVIKKGPGYTELAPFTVPIIGTKGHLYQLDNGQAVAIIPKKGPATIKTFVKTGSFDEPEYIGIRHFIEHSLFNGSKPPNSKPLGPNEFVEAVTEMGGAYNASTDTADTDYFVRDPLDKKDELEKYLKLHADMIMFPAFTDEMIEKEKGPVISEIQMYQDDPYDQAYNALIKNLFGIKTDYQGLIAGASKTIQGLNRDIVKERFESNYSPDKMLTVIVGDVNPDEAINIASPLFNRKKAASVPQQEYDRPLNVTTKPVRQDIYTPHINAGLVAIGLAGPKNNDIKETYATTALLTALTGYKNARLTKALKPFNSEPTSDMSILSSNFNAPQMMQITANFQPEQIEDGLKATYSAIQQLAQQPLSRQEMSLVKNKMKDNLASLSESSMTIADLVGEAVTGHGDIRAYSEIEKHIDSLTAQDVQNAAMKYLDMNRVSLVVMHPQGEQAAQDTKKVGFSGNSEQFKFNNIKEYNLPNNLHLIMNDDPWATKTSANLAVKADGIKTLKPGVADVLSLMLKKGTGKYSEEQLNQVLDTYNIKLDTGADGNEINLATSTTAENLPVALRMMKEILYNPDLSQETFDKAKEEVKLIYSSVPKDPKDRAKEALYPDYDLGVTPRKTLEEIDKVTLADVHNFYQQVFADSQGTMAIDGAISKSPGLDTVIFAELQNGMMFNQHSHLTTRLESKPLEKPIVIAEAQDNKSQADVVQAFKIKESGNIKDQAALVLLNEVLGGNSNARLFKDLREKQKLAYRTNSTYESDANYGTLTLLIKTTTEDDLVGPKHENLQKSLDGFKKHLNNLKTNLIPEKELETAKEQVKKDISDRMEFSSLRADTLQAGFDTYYGAQYNNALVDAIEKITSEDINKAANLYLKQPSAISLIASPDTIKDMKPYLETLGEVVVY